MFLLDDVWVASATDLVTALRCEYQLLHTRAAKAGLVERLEVPEDGLLKRAADLGLAHEDATLQQLIATHGTGAPGGVVSIEQPSTSSRAALEEAHRQTQQAMEDGAEIVFQAAFFDGRFHGLADFLVRTTDDDGRVRYEPADTKFARRAKVEALLQLASYAFQVEQMGFPAPREVHLWLGDGTRTHHREADLRPILLDRTDRLRALLDAPLTVPEWGTDEVRWCGWCDHCRAAADARRDVLLVAGMRADQRTRFVEAGIATIDQLATATSPPPAVKDSVFAKLRAQAALQSRQDASADDEHPGGVVTAELADPAGIALIPPPNPGDVFFDFEGDPLHVAAGWNDLGLEYLFGTVTHGPDGEPEYRALWAHDRPAERRALEEFLDWLADRRRQPGWEGLHVYHYAPYEVTALKKLVQRYGTRADELDTLLKEGVFVDLYSVVRRSVRVSQRSYSIKKLEPLYMGEAYRDGEVQGGAESVVWYAESQLKRAEGEVALADEMLEELRSYNEYDCVSTLRLRDLLLSLPGGERPHVGADPAGDAPADPADNPARDLADALRAPLIDLPPDQRTPEQHAVALLAAALEYHRRESLPFWWNHFRRIGAPAEDWEHDGEMIVLDPADITVTVDWHRPARTWTRTYEAVVDLPGSFKLKVGAGDRLFAIYDAPLPGHARQPTGTDRGAADCVTLDALEAHGSRSRATITEKLPMAADDPGPDLPFPVAISAGSGPVGTPMAKAIYALASSELADDGTFAAQPAMDLLQRLPPRLQGGGPLAQPEPGAGLAGCITDALRRLDRSYLAVQGPPGTGKSTLGAAIIAELVAEGWKIGVVAQSHRTVESLLDKVVDAGVDPAHVLKKDGGAGEHRGTTATDAALLAAACATVADGEPGWLIGGTSWDFVSDKRVPAGSLDLLVIDEAGQFSLADTIAVSRAAPRLLLLGDPQQLSQVSQAQHPEPVDRAALSFLADGHDTLPPELGYFLGRTYRMRPELTAVVSHLAYDDRLDADPCTSDRTLDGVAPGLQTVLVEHQGNRASSAEEVAAVVELVDDLLGRTWTDPGHPERPGPRPLDERDLVVVAPFNAQVNRLAAALAAAGHPDIAVGSVDRFQGREAPVAIVSMASSSAARSSRGPGFLLSRHRLNVAISRAQHTAYLVHAPQLTDFVPATPAGLARLGAFLGVSRAGRP